MNMTAFFLAQRILLGNVYQKNISTMTLICFIGIFIGSFSLALVTAIMNGFEITIHQKMQGIHSNIIIQSYRNGINTKVLSSILHKEFPEIRSFSPMATHHVLLRTNDQLQEDTPTIVIIKGIDPQAEKNTSTLSHKMVTTLDNKPFTQLFKKNHIIIGKKLAEYNKINVNDNIELLFLRDGHIHGKKVVFDSQQTIVTGIFDTGIDEFDNGVVYCSLDFLEKLYPNIDVDQINVTINPHVNEEQLIQKLRKRLGLDVYSWKDLYPSLVATLKLEKYVSFFILALILLVASMNIISLLFMQITQKRPDIAILKAMGMSDRSISSIFFMIGMTISCIASGLGLACALFISWLLQKYPFITLPDSYYVTQLPITMDGEIITAVFCVVILFTLFATWLPIRHIKTINVSRVLRFEG